MTLNRSVQPPVHPMPTLSMPPAEIICLPSGATIYAYNGGEADVTTLSVALDGGIINSPSPEISALLAPAWIEGTTEMSAAGLADFFDYRGAWIDTSPGIRSLNLNLIALNSTLDEIFPVVGGMLSSPLFDGERLSAVAQRTASALAVNQASVGWKASSGLKKLIYGAGHPLQREASPARLGDISSDDLRRYYHSLLNRKGINVFIGGRLNDSMITRLAEVIDSVADTGINPPVEVPLFNPSDIHSAHIVVDDASQSAVRIGMILPGRDCPDFVALRLLVAALGGYFGSRLMLNVREDKGYTYGINATFLGYPCQSVMSITADCDAHYVDALINECRIEIERMKDPSSYTSDELDRLKRITLSNLAAMLDTPFTIIDYYRTSFLAGAGERYFERQQEAVRNLTAGQLACLARKYFDTADLYISTAGK